MKSIPTISEPITQAEFVTKVHGSDAGSTPFVVAIAGGSASGKTTLAQLLTKLLPNATLFSQDSFQLGQDFAERKTSPYKWDDPKNFCLDQCAVALADLKRGETVVIPAFDVVTNQRSGTEHITPSNHIIWEGIYALGSGDIRRSVDLSVFIDAPFLVRFIRRIGRFFATRDIAQIDDLSTPARQMLTFVWAAEKDFVLKQRETADFYIPFNDVEIEAELAAFSRTMIQRVPASLRQPPHENEVHSAPWNDMRIVLTNTSLVIYVHKDCIYVAPIPPELHEQIHENLRAIIT